MREIKIRYICQHEETGYIISKIWNIEDIETPKFNEWICYDIRRYGLVARRMYTGLKDKNGVDIYVGDIWKSSENGIECIGVVEYHGCAFRVKYSNTSELLGLAIRYGEVIGSIHQNPELLADGSV